MNLEAQVISLAVWALRNAKSKRQLRGKRKPILFSAALNWLFRVNLICGNAEETKSQLCPGCLPPEGAFRGGAGPGLLGRYLQSRAPALSCATDHVGPGETFRPLFGIMSLNTQNHRIKSESVLLEYRYQCIKVRIS